MLSGERFSDHPVSVCPVIGSLLRAYNDNLDDRRRQDLYRYAAEAVFTREDFPLQRRRAQIAIEWARDRYAARGGATAPHPVHAEPGQRAERDRLVRDGRRWDIGAAFAAVPAGGQTRPTSACWRWSTRWSRSEASPSRPPTTRRRPSRYATRVVVDDALRGELVEQPA